MAVTELGCTTIFTIMRYYPLATASFILIALLVEAVCFMPLPLTYQYVSSIHKLTQILSLLKFSLILLSICILSMSLYLLMSPFNSHLLTIYIISSFPLTLSLFLVTSIAQILTGIFTLLPLSFHSKCVTLFLILNYLR